MYDGALVAAVPGDTALRLLAANHQVGTALVTAPYFDGVFGPVNSHRGHARAWHRCPDKLARRHRSLGRGTLHVELAAGESRVHGHCLSIVQKGGPRSASSQRGAGNQGPVSLQHDRILFRTRELRAIGTPPLPSTLPTFPFMCMATLAPLASIAALWDPYPSPQRRAKLAVKCRICGAS